MPTSEPSPGSGELPAIRAARSAGLAITVIRNDGARSLLEAAEQRGQEPRDLIKTMVVRLSAAEFVLVLVPGDRRISWSRLRSLVGRSRLSLASAEEAHAVTGYRRGTITPFGVPSGIPVIADASMVGRQISLGVGEPGAGMLVDADAALRVLGARVEDVTEAEDSDALG